MQQINVDGAIVPQSNIRTVVIKPAFQNRRIQSNYLKESYPAGFHTNHLRKQIVHKIHNVNSIKIDRFNSDAVGSYTLWKTTVHDDNNTMWSMDTPLIPNPKNNHHDYDKFNKSFNDGIDIDGDDDNDDIDPYADVAGPFYTDLIKSKRNVKQPSKDDINQFDSMITTEMPLHDRAEKFKKSLHDKIKGSTINDQPMHVYNAPSAMPKLTSKLTQNKIKNNLINSNVTEYDKWVSNLQLNKNNEVWLNKGNDINYNYSAYNFNGIIYKESDRPKVFNNNNFSTTSNVINASSNTITVTSDDNNDIINGNGSNIITKSSTTIGSGGGIHIILNTNKHVNFDEDINSTDHQQQQQHEQQIGVLRLQSDSNDGNYSQSINDSELSPKSCKKSLSSNFLSYNDVDFNNNIIDNDYTNDNNDNNSNNIIMLNTINNITSDYMSIANNNISNNLLLNPLPTYMIISVSTYNQIIKADSILDNHNNHNYIKKVLSNIKLVELKMLITQTIIKGLEIAFHKQNQTHYLYKYYKYLHQQMKNDITNKIIEFNNYYNINLTFQCYYSYIPGWKIINDENDWFNAKHIVYNTFLNSSKQQQQQQHDNNHQHNYDPNRSFLSYNSTTNSSNYHHQQQQYSNLPTIKLIYSLSHESELKLLEQIQKFYKYQKEQFLLQSNPHISLKSLTETLDNSISIKNNNYQNHNNNNKIGINSSTTTSNTVNNNIDNNSNIINNNNNKLKSKKTIITSLSSNASVSSGATVSSASMPSLSLYKNDLNITNNDNNNSDNNVPTNKMKVKVILKKKSSSEVDNDYDDSNIHNNDKTTTNIHINNYNLPLTATTLTNHEIYNNNNNSNSTSNTNNNNISNNNSNYTTPATLPLVKISSTSNTNYIQDNNIDHNNNNNLIFITKPKKTSIFYPPRKESLDQLYEKLEISLPKQYDYANNLEQKILKTKW